MVKVFSLRRRTIDLDELDADHLSFKGAMSARGLAAIDDPGPTGFNRDFATVVVGKGADDFAAAQAALTEWVMFSMPWITLAPAAPRLELGRIAVVAVRVLGVLTVVNASRITLLVDEDDDRRHRWGFVYATLGNHAALGEEVFLITHDHTTDEVSYSLVADSRPAGWVSWLGYPVTRWYQRRFRRESCAAMQRAVSRGTNGIEAPGPGRENP